MAQTILTLKDELAGMLHGTNIDDVHYPLGVFYRAARQMLLDCDPFETKRLQALTTPVYEDIFTYAAPDDLDMNGIIDLRPQVNRNGNVFDQRYSRGFDQYKENDTITVEYVNGTKVVRISKRLNAPTILNLFSATTGWAVGGDATNLTLDRQFYTTNASSLNFDLNGSTTSGYIEYTGTSSFDLSDDENISRLFLDVFFPDSSAITSVNLRWGNDSSNYYNVTATSPFDQSTFVNGWNTIGFDWNGATETGTVDSENIDYVRVTINYDGDAETDIRVDNLRSIIGEIYDLQYYSNYLFIDATTSAMKLQPETDDDLVILEPQSMNVYLAKVAEMAAQQAQQQGTSIDVAYFASEYQRALQNYRSLYPSEKIKPKSFYYKLRRPTNQRGVRTY